MGIQLALLSVELVTRGAMAKYTSEQRRAYRDKWAAEGRPEVQRKTLNVRVTRMLSCARERARVQGVPYDLDRQDIHIPERCPVLGIPIVLFDDRFGRRCDGLATLDRIEPAKGYVCGNVWVISHRANRLKADASLDELRMMVVALEEQERSAFRRKSHMWLTRAA